MLNFPLLSPLRDGTSILGKVSRGIRISANFCRLHGLGSAQLLSKASSIDSLSLPLIFITRIVIYVTQSKKKKVF